MSDAAWQSVALERRHPNDGGETLPEQIASHIAELIESGRLSAGARLPAERELARIFGVSRLAVREAAHRLEARGLVVVRRGAGSFVAAPAAPEPPAEQRAAGAPLPVGANVDEVADVRMLLEPAAADWAARRADRAAAGALARIVERFDRAAAALEPRFDLLVAADAELHAQIAEAADNELLARLVEQLNDLYRVQHEWSLRRPGRLQETAAEHRRIVEAIAAGDPAGAREAMTAHLAAAAASFRAVAAGAAAD